MPVFCIYSHCCRAEYINLVNIFQQTCQAILKCVSSELASAVFFRLLYFQYQIMSDFTLDAWLEVFKWLNLATGLNSLCISLPYKQLLTRHKCTECSVAVVSHLSEHQLCTFIWISTMLCVLQLSDADVCLRTCNLPFSKSFSNAAYSTLNESQPIWPQRVMTDIAQIALKSIVITLCMFWCSYALFVYCCCFM